VPRFLPEQLLLELADISAGTSIGGAALAALAGDEVAELAVLDHLEEDDMLLNPFKVGDGYFVCTVTLYYAGRVVESGFGWVTLEDASWVHWTGRLSVLLRKKSFKAAEFGQRKPRTEFCGRVTLSTSSVVSLYPWPVDALPKEPIE